MINACYPDVSCRDSPWLMPSFVLHFGGLMSTFQNAAWMKHFLLTMPTSSHSSSQIQNDWNTAMSTMKNILCPFPFSWWAHIAYAFLLLVWNCFFFPLKNAAILALLPFPTPNLTWPLTLLPFFAAGIFPLKNIASFCNSIVNLGCRPCMLYMCNSPRWCFKLCQWKFLCFFGSM